MRRFVILIALFVGLPIVAPGQERRLPNRPDSLKFAVVGDTGQPGSGQNAIAKQMVLWRARFPFEFVLMNGDNLYGGEGARDYERKFVIPYRALIDGGVKFYAALGNHDEDGQTQYRLFNMDGKKHRQLGEAAQRRLAQDGVDGGGQRSGLRLHARGDHR